MTDDFEDLIRSAGRGLGTAGETPTYHGAYKRGQRRRFVRRAAMTTAGACIVVLAFAASVGPFGSSESTEVADVVTNAVEATPSATVPTTAPVLSVPPMPDDATVAPDLDVPEVSPVPTVPQPTEQPTSAPQPTAPIVIPVPSPDPPSTVETIDEPTAVPTPTEAPIVATATPVQTVEPTDSPEDPTAVAGVSVFGGREPETAAATGPAPVEADSPAPTATTVAATDQVPTATPSPTATAAPTPTVPGRSGGGGGGGGGGGVGGRGPAPADAVVLVDISLSLGATTFLCDTDSDGATDSNCELLTSYACSSEAEATEGFVADDTDGDGVLDTCVPTGDLQCQVTSLGTTSRVPCLIYQVFN